MSAIVIKTEKDECEDVRPQIKEGGGADSSCTADGGNSVSSSAVASMGPKAVVEKTQAALKVASEAKQVHFRLKDQNLLMPQKQRQMTTKFTNQIGKRVASTKAEQLQTDANEKQNSPFILGNKRLRVQAPPPGMQKLPAISPSKCGEIFVTSNSRKWIFVCTYCQKTTRDIGEFVCHIKFKHMPEEYHEDDDYDGEEKVPDQQELNETFPDDCYDNLDQDYFDCTNYLDVNVHTDADEQQPNNGFKSKTCVNAERLTRPKDINSRETQKNTFVFDLLDEDDEDNSKRNSDLNIKKQMFEYDMEDDEEGVEVVGDDNNEMESVDDDNLLFLRTSSIEDTVGDGSGVSGKSGNKKYRSHVRGKAYCNLCDKTFQYYSLYRNHMIKHSNITPYKCEYCSKAFKSKQAIRYHMNTHTKEVQYTCPLCPMTYGTENQFITHVLNHESDSCFPCMVCAKILKSDAEREEHLSTHTEERPFGCNYCNKRFRQKHHLSNHLKLHCQYRCDFCKEEFSSTQTQRRPYACASCEEYPEIRIQVERQRSKSLNNTDVNPLEITNEGGGVVPHRADNTECVDLASDDDDDQSETNTSLVGRSNGQNRVICQYCTRAYKNYNVLNHHMRQKHSHLWRERK